MGMEYKATLFAPDGDKVTDFRHSPSVDDVLEKIADMGSRWFFYPLWFVTTDITVRAAPYGYEWAVGKHIKTVQGLIEQGKVSFDF